MVVHDHRAFDGRVGARHIEVTGYRKPHARVWTDGRVEQWRRTGQRRAVAVWTAEHLATFLAAVALDSPFALWWRIALHGLRRVIRRAPNPFGGRTSEQHASNDKIHSVPPPTDWTAANEQTALDWR